MKKTILAAALACVGTAVGGCAPWYETVVHQGDKVPTRSEETIARARAEGETERARLAEERERVETAALAGCAPGLCEAIARGEIALGMTGAQVLAATRTTAEAWETRGSGRTQVMAGRTGVRGPSDAVAEVAYVTLQDGRVRGYTYREHQGFRAVTSPADATLAGRAAAQAEALLREGDDFAVRGYLDAALDRYDRADILRPGHPETTLRIARTLDKALRPLEALMRYQQFLHQMELERIRAHGEAWRHMANAIAHARERVIVLEKRR
jgi:tetratricopeptide (TPR) repeat protein